MSEQRLWFDKVGTGKAYTIRNITNDILGSIEYRRTGAFMHYVFVMPLELMKDCIEKNEDIYFSPGCLDEVRQKIKELNAKSCVLKDVDEIAQNNKQNSKSNNLHIKETAQKDNHVHSQVKKEKSDSSNEAFLGTQKNTGEDIKSEHMLVKLDNQPDIKLAKTKDKGDEDDT